MSKSLDDSIDGDFLELVDSITTMRQHKFPLATAARYNLFLYEGGDTKFLDDVIQLVVLRS